MKVATVLELGALLHDLEAQRDDLRRQQEADHVDLIRLHQGADDTQARQPEVLEGALCGLRVGVEEGVQEEGDVRIEELRARVVVRGDALDQGEGVADAVAHGHLQRGWGQRGVHRYDLLQQHCQAAG